MNVTRTRFLILGAGPTGLGAAWRLHELGETDWRLIEASDRPGGLACSILDERGYTWDMGGHIQFSHYDYFDRLMNELLAPEEWLSHERESWVWIEGRFVPYPFQNNLRYLTPATRDACVEGLLKLKDVPTKKPRHFADWYEATFGEGICRAFMRPYNFKVWAYPPEEMDYRWIGDRVAVTNVERVMENIRLERDDLSWGPNQTFRFPLRGGTGEVWRRCAARLPAEKLSLGTAVASIDTSRRRVTTKSGETIEYESLISTMPLDRLIAISDLAKDEKASEAASRLLHSSTHVVGLGVHGAPPDSIRTKCWMYFPEDDAPFYRATVFSNYSPNNVPDIRQGWSLMVEVSESSHRPVDAARIVEMCVRGAAATKLVERKEDIVHTWHRRLEHGYPTPGLKRDEALAILHPLLESRGVFSRGRFGAWKYEVSNQDHSLMQGVECVNRLLNAETEMTLDHPEIVNKPKL